MLGYSGYDINSAFTFRSSYYICYGNKFITTLFYYDIIHQYDVKNLQIKSCNIWDKLKRYVTALS